jgi:hypothetical protein
MVTTGEVLSLRETADALDIEPWRVFRLGRYLGIDPAEKRIPLAEVERISRSDRVEDRFSGVRTWLLGSMRKREAPLTAADRPEPTTATAAR